MSKEVQSPSELDEVKRKIREAEDKLRAAEDELRAQQMTVLKIAESMYPFKQHSIFAPLPLFVWPNHV